MNYLFSNCCSSLEKIDLSKFNTDDVLYMDNMFNKCPSLKELDLSNFNTKKVYNKQQMFNSCQSLKKLIYLI